MKAALAEKRMLAEITKNIAEVLVRLPFWAIFSAPIFVALFFAGRLLKKRGASIFVRLIFGVVAAFLLFPMPMGMFLALLPNGYLMLGEFEHYIKLWRWAAVSFPITAVISCTVAVVSLKPLNNSLQPTGIAGG